jgi:uncharacterized protein
MLIVLTHLPADGQKFEHQYEPDELDLSAHVFSFQQLPFVQGRVTALGMEMRVKGNLRAQLAMDCDRCLEAVTLPIDNEFALYYLPEDAQAQSSGETELLERDLDVSTYHNDRIDLNELVLEQLELSLPARVLCTADCKGLCSQCGTNLNVESCHCQPPMDPRWHALTDLKS